MKTKCITFDKAAQDTLPEDIKAKMRDDRIKARIKAGDFAKFKEGKLLRYAEVLEVYDIDEGGAKVYAIACPVRVMVLIRVKIGRPSPELQMWKFSIPFRK